MIEFPCPHCGVNISAESEYAGITTQCPACSGEILVPPLTNPPDEKLRIYNKIINSKKTILIGISIVCFVIIFSTMLSIFSPNKKNQNQVSKSKILNKETQEVTKEDPDNPKSSLGQYDLGSDYYSGNKNRGRQKNYNDAIVWFYKSARQGNVAALLQLGVMCHEGHGFEKSADDAHEYWLLAAKAGDLLCQYQVGISFGMRSENSGFTNASDMIISYFWLSLFQSSDYRDSKLKSNANSMISLLEKKMTSQQVTAAQQMAREWKKEAVDVAKLDLLLSKTYPNALLDLDQEPDDTNNDAVLGDIREGIASVKIGGKYGYIDKQGRILIKPQFDVAGNFNQGLAIAKIGGKTGFIDQDGKFVIELKIDPHFIEPFSEGLAKVSVKLKSGFIDESGNSVIKPQFDRAESFREGLAAVEVGRKSEVSPGKWGFIDKQGKLVIKPEFDNAQSFSDGLAQVRVGQKYGYIDKQGKFVIEPKFSIIMLNGLQMNGNGDSFSEGLARVRIGDKYGFIDKQGKIAIDPKFDGAGAFKEGLACVTYDGKSGFIDKQGEFVIRPKFDEALDFYEGLASVKIGSKLGFINKQGEIVISPKFDFSYGSYFDGGVAMVMTGDKYGFIDKKGKFVIKPQFDDASGFSKPLAK